jgi:hypothetical protein
MQKDVHGRKMRKRSFGKIEMGRTWLLDNSYNSGNEESIRCV